MSEPAKVSEDRAEPGQWRVERFDDDGRCGLEIFDGHDAERQALRTPCGNTAIAEKSS